jgi:hypothetical protein
VLSSRAVAGGSPATVRVSNSFCQTPWRDQRTFYRASCLAPTRRRHRYRGLPIAALQRCR